MYFTEDMQDFFGSDYGKVQFGENPEGFFFWRKVVGQLVLNPGVLCVALFRLSAACAARKIMPASLILDRFNEFATGAQFPHSAEFGPGLQVHHPEGLVVSPEAIGGARVMLMGGVALGVRDLRADPRGKSPILGDDVTIGSGAKIIGPVKLGDRVQVAANSVVMIDVPDDGIAVGSPAKIIFKKGTGPKAEEAPAAK
jgi:serine O-acetyltransferase